MNSRTHIAYWAVIILFSQSFFSPQVLAQQDESAALIAIIDEVEKGWIQGDAQPFHKHFLDFDGARYIESGRQNVGLTDLIEHHVETEGAAFDSFEISFSNIDTHHDGDFAWAVADLEFKATLKGGQGELHYRGYETFLFRRVDGNWMIIHTHNSSSPVKSD